MGKRASREQGLAGTAGTGSHNFDFELFSPESSLRISEGKALVVGEIGLRGRVVLKGLLVGRMARG